MSERSDWALPRMMSTYSRWVASRLRLGEDLRHSDHPVHGRADLVTHIGEEVALRAVGRLGGELCIEGRLLGHLAVRHDLHGTCEPHGFAVRVTLGLGAQAHPLEVAVPVLHPDFHIEQPVTVEVLVHRGEGLAAILWMDQPLEALARARERSGSEPEELLESRTEPELAGGDVEFPHPVARAAHGTRQALFGRGQRGFCALELGDIHERTREAHRPAVGAVDDVRFLADPALQAVGKLDPVCATIGGPLRARVERRAANALEVVGVHVAQSLVPLGERRGRRQAHELVEVLRAYPALPRQIEVHGRNARDGLRDAERFGLLLERLLQALAGGDIGDRADEAGWVAIGIAGDLTARGDPAHGAVRGQRAVFGIEVQAAADCMTEGLNDRLEVLPVHGGEPVVAMESEAVRGNADDLEEKRRRFDLAARQIQIEDAESTGALGKTQELCGAVQLALPGAAEAQGIAHALGEGVELVGPGGGRSIRVRQRGERLAHGAHAARAIDRPEDCRGGDRDRQRAPERPCEAGLGRRGQEQRGQEQRGGESRRRPGDHLGANRPTAHAASKIAVRPRHLSAGAATP